MDRAVDDSTTNTCIGMGIIIIIIIIIITTISYSNQCS